MIHRAIAAPVAALATAAILTGCDLPPAGLATTPANAIPFADLLAANADTPFECSDYDAATDTCTSLTTYRQMAPDQYQLTSTLLLEPNLPPLELSAVLNVRNGTPCVDLATSQARGLGADGSLQAELMLAQIERLYAELGEVCGVYVPAGDAYTFRFISGPDDVLSEPPQTITFFARPKPLRVE